MGKGMRLYVYLTFFWVILFGAFAIFFGPNGPIVVCIACTNLVKIGGVISILWGAAGLVGMTRAPRTALGQAR